MQRDKIKNTFFKIHDWLQTPLGKHLLNIEKSILSKNLNNIYGYNALIIGQPDFVDCLTLPKFNNKILLNQFPLEFPLNNTPKTTNNKTKNNKNNNKNPKLNNNTITTPSTPSQTTNIPRIPTICSREDKLPIAEESLDLIYLPHTLEFVNNPHETLRETYRILKPEGHLIITSFNSISIWGIIKIILGITNKTPWQGKFYTKLKLSDWLALLGYNIYKTNYYIFNLPINNQNYLKKTKFIDNLSVKLNIPLGSCFSLIAKKRTQTLTPITPEWKNQNAVLNNKNIAEPTCFD